MRTNRIETLRHRETPSPQAGDPPANATQATPGRFRGTLPLWLIAVMASLACLAHVAQAAISVPVGGTPTLTFDTTPAETEWATGVLTGSGGTYANEAQMDAGANTVTAANVVRTLPTSTTVPPSTFSGGFRHNLAAFYIQSRPTTDGTNAASILKATLVNDIGAAAATLTIAYDFAVQSAAAGELRGYYVYYSLSGAPGSWVKIPALSGSETVGRVTATADLGASGWQPGTELYLLWADDNANGVSDPSYTIDNVTFAAAPITAVAIVTQPPALTTVEQGRPFTLTLVASGAPILYQWYKEGVGAIVGATGPSYSVAEAVLGPTGDSGNYYCIVGNSLGDVTSTTAQVTVQQDTTPPVVARQTAYPSFDPLTQAATQDRVIVEFNERMDLTLAEDEANYSLSDGAFDYPVGVAVLTNNGTTVVLTTALMPENTPFLLTLYNLTDHYGNPLGEVTVPFRSWVSSPGNGLLFETFASSSATRGPINNIPTEAAGWPDNPRSAHRLYAFDSRIVYADDLQEDYVSRTSGLFVPPFTGNWRFFIRSDDPSRLFLNPTGASAAGKLQILDETGCCGDWNKFISAAFPLQAGQGYYIEALQREYAGGDYIKVAARLDGTGYPPTGVANLSIDPYALAGTEICSPLAPADAGGALTLTGPADVSLVENQLATFTVTASNPSGLPMSYQWRSNGVDIAGATGPTFSYSPAIADNGALFSVQVAKIGSVAVSREALLTVTEDTTAPTVVAVHGAYRLDQVIVSFSELVDPGTATDGANYSIPGFSFIGAALDSTGTNVILTSDTPLTPGQIYDLTIRDVLDRSGRNTVPTTTLPLYALVLSRGFAMEQLYFNIPGVILLDLTTSPKYPNSPDRVNYKTTLEGPTDTYDNYGTRLSGWVMPPTDGEHVFYFCSDDPGQLSLSPDSSPANVVPVAREISYSGARTWTGPGNNADRGNPPSNISTQILAASQMYAFEALAKEGTGGDNSGVAWKLPGLPVPNNGTPGIAGAFLYALADPVGASLTITQQPADAVAVYYGASAPVAAIDQDFNANDGGFTVTNYGAPVGPWSYNASAGSWTNHGESACTGPYASGLNAPAITLPNGGAAVLTFNHRYHFEGLDPGDAIAWDGGQVRVSLNGGPFRTLPPANFTLNGYIAPIGGSVTPLLTNTPGWLNIAFVGESPGWASGSFLTSVANLGFFDPGDTLAIQFTSSWDECSEGGLPNWELDSVKVDVAAGVPTAASFTVGATSTYLAQPNLAIAYVWQRDAGAGFEDILGAYSPTYTATFDLADSGTPFRCLVYSPAASAISQTATLTVTLPLTMVRQGSSARISWPLNNAGFVLQRAATVPSATWTTIAGPYQSDGSSYYVTVSTTSGNAFYRLRRP